MVLISKLYDQVNIICLLCTTRGEGSRCMLEEQLRVFWQVLYYILISPGINPPEVARHEHVVEGEVSDVVLVVFEGAEIIQFAF